VLVSGLAAGLVVNVGEFVLNGLLLRGEWEAAMRSLGRPPLGGASIVSLNLMVFALGIITMWMYAAIRPSFGTDREAAIRAGLACWLLAYVLGFGWSFAMGVFPATLYFPTLVWSVVEVLLGTLAGAWLHGRQLQPRSIHEER